IKGDINEIADKCSFVRFNGENIKIQDDKRKNINAVVDDILEDGIKVIAVAIKNIQQFHLTFLQIMTLILFLK
ncbi:Magnesium-translocating P-type ATPase, partial [human gut metagenome]